MSKEAFLRQLYTLQAQANEDVYSIDLEEALKTNYMEVSRLSAYWEEIGAVKHFSQRGGTGTVYRLTEKGQKLAQKMQKQYQQKKVGLIIISILILISVLILRA